MHRLIGHGSVQQRKCDGRTKKHLCLRYDSCATSACMYVAMVAFQQPRA